MTNITYKQPTLRKAIASAIVKASKPETIAAVINRQVPKGDVFEFARAAALLSIKKTSDIIPDCHPLPVEYTAVSYETDELTIKILIEVHTIYKTGVEVEAMHGASVAALVIYDMLKPIDKGVSIQHIQLEEKKGGKSDYASQLDFALKTAVIVCSDTISAGLKQDMAGKTVIQKLQQQGIETNHYDVLPDNVEQIQQKAKELAAEAYDLILFTGGTGLSPKDVTPEAIQPLLDREIPGIMETARRYGQQLMPYAMLSRGVAGFMGSTLIITLPGSTKGATETMDAIFPSVLHVFKVAKGERHD